MSLVGDARLDVADLLLMVGPDGATLLPGWNAADLAAHLVMRDRRPDALAGIGGDKLGKLGQPLVSHSEKVRLGYAALPWDELVAMVRQGPPRWSPLSWSGLGAVNERANLLEYVIHGEDLRRAHPELPARELDPALAERLWSHLRLASSVFYRHCPVGVRLVRTDLPTHADPRHHSLVINAKKPREDAHQPLATSHTPPASSALGDQLVTVRGPVLELVLHTFGRDQASHHHDPASLASVSVDGSEQALQAYRTYPRRA